MVSKLTQSLDPVVNEWANDITKVQRMIYSIKGGLSNDFIKEELEYDFEDVTKELNKVLGTLNKYTHINKKVYYRDERSGDEMVEKTLLAFNNFLITVETFKEELINKLEERLHYVVSDALTEDVINEIDILATHYWVNGSIIEKISIDYTDSTSISISVNGYVEVVHQYGSDRDYNKGFGDRIESSYPWELSLVLDVNDPLDISLESKDVIVDNSSFYE
jgi:hypothetical protein